jgi:NAD+ synthase
MASKLTKQIIKWLEEYRDNTQCRGVVLGISGGKDSTTVAMLAKKVWGDNVVGIMMPDGGQVDLDDSVAICSSLNLRHALVNIGGAVTQILHGINASVPFVDVNQKAITNIPPRVRMTTLYAIAQTLGYRVIGTGNASEAYIGWTTKWGDSAYDLNPIAGLTCGEVVEVGLDLAKDLGLDEKYIVKKPSDGLTGLSDEDNFGFTYSELDGFINGVLPESAEVGKKIIAMHTATEHKRCLPYCFRKE